MSRFLSLAAALTVVLLYLQAAPVWAAPVGPSPDAARCVVMVQEAGAVSVQDTYEQGYAEGTAAALGTNTNTAMMVGCGSTCVFFLVGACGSWATYRFLVPVGEVPLDTSSHSPEYREGFEDGYNKAVRKARSKAALTGAVPALLLGTLAISMATLLG